MDSIKKYSVVQIIDSLESGGAENILVTLSNLLYANGHKVTVITTMHKGAIANKLVTGIQLKELNRKSKFSLACMKKLIDWCKPFDIVHVHSSHNLRYLFAAAKIFRLNKKIFFHEHFGNIDIDKSVSWHQRLIYPSVKLIAVSNSLYNWALQNAKLKANNVFLLPNTISKFNNTNKTVVASQNKINIIMAANFRPAKNIEFAIDIMQQFVQKANVHLTIVGQTFNKEYYNLIVQKINNAGLQHAVTIQPNCHNVQSILNQFNIAIHTAKTESGPLVLIEYMAQQLPFITYDTGEVVQQIKPNLPQLVINNFIVENWINQITQILQSNTQGLKEKLEIEFNTHYSEQAYYNTCIEIYNKGMEG